MENATLGNQAFGGRKRWITVQLDRLLVVVWDENLGIERLDNVVDQRASDFLGFWRIGVSLAWCPFRDGYAVQTVELGLNCSGYAPFQFVI